MKLTAPLPCGRFCLLCCIFTGIYIAVHLEAKKLGLKGIARDQLPRLSKLVRRIYLLAPLVLLVVLVSTNTRTMAYSAAWPLWPPLW